MTQQLHEAHRVMMQILWSNQILSEGSLNEILTKIFAHYQLDPVPLEMFLRTINKNIEFMGFEIRKIIGEDDGISYWGIANTKADDFAKGATVLDNEQLKLFQLIIRKLVEKESGELPKTDLINLRLEITERQVTASKAEETIDYLIKTKWLKLNNGKISLGPRTFLELKEYIETTFNDIINECLLCQEVVIKGQRCANSRCPVRMHHHCSLKWFQNKNDKQCPSCKNAWIFPVEQQNLYLQNQNNNTNNRNIDAHVID